MRAMSVLISNDCLAFSLSHHWGTLESLQQVSKTTSRLLEWLFMCLCLVTTFLNLFHFRQFIAQITTVAQWQWLFCCNFLPSAAYDVFHVCSINAFCQNHWFQKLFCFSWHLNWYFYNILHFALVTICVSITIDQYMSTLCQYFCSCEGAYVRMSTYRPH